MNGYKIISELVLGNPNVDMLVIKPYLYVYITRDKIEDVRKNGLSASSDGILQALFTRLPENKYSEYLKDHVPVKISVSKLSKIKDQKVVIKPVNFSYPKDSLNEDDIEKLIGKYSKQLSAMIRKGGDISLLPRVDIYFSDGVIPSFSLKVLDIEFEE